MGDDMVTCPYTKNHTMPRQRLPWHLVRCSFRHKTTMLHCPFNQLHMLTPIQFEDHIQHCPEKPVGSR